MADEAEQPSLDVDLSRLAEGYRHREPSTDSLDRARRTGLSLPEAARIADIGGGPGHHAAVWADQGHDPVVIDPGGEMTRPARDRGIAVVRGASQALPFRDASFDLAWFHLSIHYGDWRRAVEEAVRVTRDGGLIEIWTLAADHHESSMLARWFPSVTGIDAARFPDPSAIERSLAGRTQSVTRTGVTEHKQRPAGEWAAAVEAGFVSTLQLVDGRERREGLAAFHRAHPDPSVEITYELRFDQVRAIR